MQASSGPCPFGCHQAGVRNGLIVSPDQPYLVCDLQASLGLLPQKQPLNNPRPFRFENPGLRASGTVNYQSFPRSSDAGSLQVVILFCLPTLSSQLLYLLRDFTPNLLAWEDGRMLSSPALLLIPCGRGRH